MVGCFDWPNDSIGQTSKFYNHLKLDPSIFGAIVYNVPADSMATVLKTAQANGITPVHVTDDVIGAVGPKYWDYMLLNMNQDEECGCEDVDECVINSDLCDDNAACINTVGSYGCICSPEYVGDGRTDGTGCTEDVCAKCDEDAECDYQGRCSCPAGMAGTGLSCPESSAFIPLHAPWSTSELVCEDENWLKASYIGLGFYDFTLLRHKVRK